ncbi:MAG: FAD-dependent oxidoreductase [Chloroflexota bacterium]
MKAIIIGCGVSGLSTGIRMIEAGHDVEIWAKDLPPKTTSNVAAAIWYPYLALPRERVLAWGQRTLEVFYGIAGEPDCGVLIGETIEVFRQDMAEPWWRSAVRHFRFAQPAELPPGYTTGYVFETAVIDTGIYLPYLMRQFEGMGGKIIERDIQSLDNALAVAETVVNCAGLGTLSFMQDTELYPVRGQVLRIEKPALKWSMLDDEEDEAGVLAYVVPRVNDCILGGVAQAGEWSLEADEATAQRIVERCALLAPEVRDMKVLEHKVGLRPGRSSVRVEVERLPGGKALAHNYGHSGAGVTLSWGCAEDIVALLKG